MSNSTSQLEEFVSLFSVQTSEITSKIGTLKTLDSSERIPAIKSVQKLLTEVNETLEQMELAVRDLPQNSPERNKYDLLVKSFRGDKKRSEEALNDEIKVLKERADRHELISMDESFSMDQQEEQLIANTERQERTSRKLQDAYRIAIETEEIGAEVLGNLGTQRETINRSRNRMREADSDLGRSSKLLNEMIRRVVRNRLLLMGVGAFLVFSLFFILYRSI